MLIRTVRLSLLAMVAILVTYFAASNFLSADPAELLRQAQQTADQADAALNKGDGPAASRQLDRLGDLLERSEKALAKAAARKNAQDHARELRAWKAELCYLRARRLRDAAYACATIDGNPLNDMLDTTTGKSVRSYLAIPSDTDRREVIVCLRQAAETLPENEAVVLDALRTELSLQPMNRPLISTLALAILKIHPRDPRALYLVARHEFDQPAADAPTQVTPAENRSATRVAKSLDYLRQLKKTGEYPLWRTLYLEAQVDAWLLHDAVRRRDQPTVTRLRGELEALLWGKGGALARARAGEKLHPMVAWDVDGVRGIFQLALELRLRDARTPADADKVVQAVRDVVDFGLRCRADKKVELSAEVLTSMAMTALLSGQPLLSRDLPAQWAGLLEHAKALLRPAVLDGQIAPAPCALFADFLLLEARAQATRGQTAESDKLAADAARWLQDGLRVAGDRKLPVAEQAPLHASFAYLQLRTGLPCADCAPHLKVLRGLKDPAAQASVSLLEALAHLRHGALEKAQLRIDEAYNLFSSGRFVRPQVVLAQLYLGSGNFERALPALRQIELAFDDIDNLAVGDRLWLLDFAPRRERLTGLIAQAHLQIAREKIARFIQKQSAKPVPAELVELHETEVDRLAKTMPADCASLAELRQALVTYYQSTSRPIQADTALTTLRHSSVHRFAALSAALWLAEQPGREPDLVRLQIELQTAVDKDAHDHAARLMLATLLARAGRTPDAATVLARSSPVLQLPGDQLLAEHLDTLGVLYLASSRPQLMAEMRDLFAAALIRYPHDARIQMRMGQARAALKEPAAARQSVRCALNLAQCRLVRLSPTQREDLTRAAEAALQAMP